MKKIETVKISGSDYAKVSARLGEFRKENPRAKITTRPEPQPDGGMIFYAEIVKDSSKKSAEATGTAYYPASKMKSEKAFEKLETISVGRALSLLGYLNNGEIASSEEMEEFEDFKKQKVVDQSKELINKLKSSKNLKELQDNFVKGVNKFKGNNEVIEELIKIKDELKGQLK